MAKSEAISSLTELPLSPQDDRRARMTKYLLAMGLRLICIALCFLVEGWWLVLCAVGAIVLPYLAVVVANVATPAGGKVARPGSIVLAERTEPRAALTES